MDIFWKRIVMNIGIVLTIAGVLFAMGTFCITFISLFTTYIPTYGIIGELLTALTLGVGIIIFRHAQQSLTGKPSAMLRLWSLPILIGIFIMTLLVGAFFSTNDPAASLFLPTTILIVAALPPLWAVSWFTPDTKAAEGRLTWRRGLVAFCGGATLSVALAIVLEILIPVVILALAYSATHTTIERLSSLLQQDGRDGLSRALTDPAFVYLFIQIAVIAPLVEELVKPLTTLPLLRRLNRQEAFWVGALAGAGFAAVENVIYASGGLSIWAGILAVRALGGALHPLGAGLVTIGWRDVIHGEPNALEKWFKQYGLAVLAHAIWNGGSLLVITLGGAQFFGVLPPEIDLLGLSMAGTTLAFLLLLGIAAMWIGRSFGHDRPLLATPETDSTAGVAAAPSERTMALWALACLLAIVPIGIAGLRLWLR